MEFIRVEGTSELELALTTALNEALSAGGPVLWILTGGSNIKVCVSVMAALEAENLDNLTMVLTDERFGAPGHADSNFFQLHQAGLMERGATFVDMLYGGSFEETVKVSADAMEHIFANSKTIIALIGMGPDGHIAGILPHSPAAVNDEVWMIGYDGGQFQRFTLTPFALSHIHECFVGTFGAERKVPLETLHDKMLPIAEQPAQILRHIPKTSIYNDQLGD